jgi:ABC-type multidrug transport system ATPase subunit
MVDAKFTIRNYRCFSDEHPLEFTLRDGFTAFVGPNNSGKSFILKFFYEFRPVWKIFLGGDLFISPTAPRAVDFLGVREKTDVFYRFNNRDLKVEIEMNNLGFYFSITPTNTGQALLKKATLTWRKKELLFLPHVSIDWDNKIVISSEGKIDIKPLLDLFDVLISSIYIPAFRNVVNIGANEFYYDIHIGEAFIRTFSQWKLGDSTLKSQKILEVTEDIKNLFDYKNLEINPSDDRKNIILRIDDKVYKLNEVGSGIIQFILVFMNAAIKQPSFILIDEPELNLHPALQLKFLTSLASYTKNGILFATHSIGLARSVADRIYSVVKKGNYSIVSSLERTPHYSELLGELSFSLYQELGVRKILLVEGPSEVKTFHQFLRQIKKDKEFIVIPLGGNSMINGKSAYEIGEFKRIINEIYCWIDSEKSSKEDELPKNRKEFLEVCKDLKIKAVASERRAIENYFSDSAIKKVLGNNYGALGEYNKANWPKEKNWLIAQNMSFDEIKNTDLGKFLQEI